VVHQPVRAVDQPRRALHKAREETEELAEALHLLAVLQRLPVAVRKGQGIQQKNKRTN